VRKVDGSDVLDTPQEVMPMLPERVIWLLCRIDEMRKVEQIRLEEKRRGSLLRKRFAADNPKIVRRGKLLIGCRRMSARSLLLGQRRPVSDSARGVYVPMSFYLILRRFPRLFPSSYGNFR